MACLMIFSNIVGVFLEWKGIHVYTNAVNALNSNTNDFFLVGKQSKVASEYYAKFIEPYKSKIIMPGFINNIIEHLKSIDILVHTSVTDDPLPTILLEGIAMGKTIIATDVGGVHEIVDDSFGNIIVSPNDINALKEAILTASRYDNQKLENIGRTNKKIAQEKFTIAKQVEKMTEIYLGTVKAK